MTDKTMRLGRLITTLEECGATTIRIASPTRLKPTGVHSYRGYYEDLAIGYAEVGSGREEPMKDFLGVLRGAMGETFEGYKGGEFRMGAATMVWLSNYGESGDARVSGVEVEEDVAWLTLTMGSQK